MLNFGFQDNGVSVQSRPAGEDLKDQEVERAMEGITLCHTQRSYDISLHFQAEPHTPGCNLHPVFGASGVQGRRRHRSGVHPIATGVNELARPEICGRSPKR